MKMSPIYPLLVTGCLMSLGLYYFWVPLVNQPGGVIYEVSPGTSHKTFVTELAHQGVIREPALFALYGILQMHPYLKSGEYLFKAGSTTASIWRQVTQGNGFALHAFTIIPGWTFKQVRQAITEATWMQQSLSGMDDQQVMSALGYPDMAPEGAFYPETYFYTKGVMDLEVLKHSYQTMQQELNAAWAARAEGLPYETAYQGLIAASLIEKEAYLEAERPIIAGVLINRLQKNMLLQFDPTVIYGIGDRYTGKITRQDLQTDTVYNTYKHRGLPPTPIAIPGINSIQAAFHPARHDYLYFVAKGDSSHQFTKTLPEHYSAIKKAEEHKKHFFNES